jgi:hypothetical protein
MVAPRVEREKKSCQGNWTSNHWTHADVAANGAGLATVTQQRRNTRQIANTLKWKRELKGAQAERKIDAS